MKKMIFIGLIGLMGLMAEASPKYGNVITQTQADELSKTVPANVQNPTAEQIWQARQAEGWRRIVQVEETPVGYRVESYAVEAIDKDTARLAVTTKINLAEEQAAKEQAIAAQAALKLAADVKAIEDQANMRLITRETLKGLLKAILVEINKREAFQSDPITAEAVLGQMETTVAAEISAK